MINANLKKTLLLTIAAANCFGIRATAAGSANLEEQARSAFLSVKTNDGNTVGDVIKFVAKMRPHEFKLQKIDVDVNANGKPQSMSACYWIGEPRKSDNVYCDTGFLVHLDAANIAAVPGEPFAQYFAQQALVAGERPFLKFIDDTYERECIDPDNHKHNC